MKRAKETNERTKKKERNWRREETLIVVS